MAERLSRRSLLKLIGLELVELGLSACEKGVSSVPTPTETPLPTPTGTPTPTSTPKPTETPTPKPTETPTPTPIPKAVEASLAYEPGIGGGALGEILEGISNQQVVFVERRSFEVNNPDCILLTPEGENGQRIVIYLNGKGPLLVGNVNFPKPKDPNGPPVFNEKGFSLLMGTWDNKGNRFFHSWLKQKKPGELPVIYLKNGELYEGLIAENTGKLVAGSERPYWQPMPKEAKEVAFDREGNIIKIVFLGEDGKRMKEKDIVIAELPLRPGDFVKESQDQYSVITEKGEKLLVPFLVGLKQELEEVNGVRTVIYRADKDNPYGLKENDFAGWFYSKVYLLGNESNKREDALQKGGVVLRSEVVSLLLKKIEAPEKNPVFPLPFDPTPSNFSNDEVIVQESKVTGLNGRPDLFLRIPPGSLVVSPYSFENYPNPDKEIVFSKQAWGTSIQLGRTSGVLFEKKFFLYIAHGTFVYFEGKYPVRLGDKLTTFEADKFSSRMREVYDQYRNPRPLTNTNVEIFAYSVQLNSQGILDAKGFTRENILQTGNSFIFVLSNQNPLLDQ